MQALSPLLWKAGYRLSLAGAEINHEEVDFDFAYDEGAEILGVSAYMDDLDTTQQYIVFTIDRDTLPTSQGQLQADAQGFALLGGKTNGRCWQYQPLPEGLVVSRNIAVNTYMEAMTTDIAWRIYYRKVRLTDVDLVRLVAQRR